jgi:hypothetical protein
MGTFTHAEEQPVGMSHSMDMVGKLVKNLDGKSLGKIKDLIIIGGATGISNMPYCPPAGFGDWKTNTPLRCPGEH